MWLQQYVRRSGLQPVTPRSMVRGRSSWEVVGVKYGVGGHTIAPQSAPSAAVTNSYSSQPALCRLWPGPCSPLPPRQGCGGSQR